MLNESHTLGFGLDIETTQSSRTVHEYREVEGVPTKDVLTQKFPENDVVPTGTKINPEYFDIKIHNTKLYYVTASHSGNTRSYDFQIEVKPLKQVSAEDVKIYKTSCSCGYDVADSGFMISEQVGIEGDIHRTVQ